MFRFKSLIGGRLRSRTFEREKTEARIGVAVLNRSSGGVGLALVVGSTLIAAQARAFSCADPVPGVTLLPASDTADVPTNSLVWVGLNGVQSSLERSTPRVVGLTSDSGESVPLSESIRFTDGGLNTWVGYSAPGELAPEVGWTVSVAFGYPGEPDYEVPDDAVTITESFVTGSGPDTVAPGVPSEVSRLLESSPNVFTHVCERAGPPFDRATFALDSEGPISLVAVGDDQPSELGAAMISGGTHGEVVVETTLQPGVEHTFRFAAVDLAGNLSGWSEPLVTPMPLAGCEREDVSPAAALLLLVLGGGPVRRRWVR